MKILIVLLSAGLCAVAVDDYLMHRGYQALLKVAQIVPTVDGQIATIASCPDTLPINQTASNSPGSNVISTEGVVIVNGKRVFPKRKTGRATAVGNCAFANSGSLGEVNVSCPE